MIIPFSTADSVISAVFPWSRIFGGSISVGLPLFFVNNNNNNNNSNDNKLIIIIIIIIIIHPTT